ncbi:MAG: aldo/keto reductase [Armatimonadetes bacterium]|nr:aldo/keto reductase [Armatimonadota bacterium]
MKLGRREFLVGAAGLLASAGHTADTRTGELPKRTLGRTKVPVSILGVGMAPLGSGHTSYAEAETLVRAALDMGVTYVDVSPDYGDAEDKLKPVFRDKALRDRVFLVTKVNPSAPDATGVQRQIENSLTRMGVDHIDAVHVHNLGDFDMATVLGPGGTLAGLKEARRRGLIKYLGTSGHMRPPRFAQALETGDIDLTMNALNFADRHTYDFEGLVLPVAKKHGTAVVAMKVLGGARDWRYDGHTPGTLADYHARAIRYSLGLPGVCVAVIGFGTVDEVRQAVAVARAYHPLSAAERAELLAEGKRLAQSRGLYYGPTEG